MPKLSSICRPLIDAALLAALLAISLFFNTANSNFPLYHPDEGSKVEQVRGDRRFNFYHPHLMLTATRGVNALVGPTRAQLDAAPNRRGHDALDRAILRNGRWVSAGAAALSAALLALAVGLHYGRFPAAVAGLAVALNHGLITRAHYMKEDTCLLLGVSVIFLGLSLLWRRRGWRALPPAALTGVGCGLAAAGKYVGVAPALAVLPITAFGPFFGSLWARVRGTQLILAIGVAVFCLINFEGVFPFEPMRRGFDRELNHITTEHTLLVSDPNGRYYLDVLLRETTWPALAGGVAFVAWLAARRRATAIDLILLLFPLAYAALLTRAAVHFDRYLLPTVVFVQLLGGAGLAVTAQAAAGWLSRRWRASHRPAGEPRGKMREAPWFARALPAAVLLAVVAAVLVSGFRVSKSCVDQFADDSRDRLNAWLLEELEPGCFIVGNSYARLDHRALRKAGHRMSRGPLDFGRYTLDHLRDNGVTHIVICNLNYDRYLNEYRRPIEGREPSIERQIEGYCRLFDEGEIIWQSTPPILMPYYVNPTITVYRVGPPHRAAGRGQAFDKH